MRILDLFAGVGGERRRKMVEARGHEYITLDLDPSFGCTITADIFDVMPEMFGHIDFIWASPPCEAFSVASIGHHWDGGFRAYKPKTQHAWKSQSLVSHTINLIASIRPTYGWLMENPRGVLRKLPCVSGLPRVTVTYCQYGDTRMKPTDIWGVLPGWNPKPMCSNGDSCHEAAPRGSRTGTQGIVGAAERAVVPIQLWEEILDRLDDVSKSRTIDLDLSTAA
jgi:site-specific DNA-cytosine methylase